MKNETNILKIKKKQTNKKYCFSEHIFTYNRALVVKYSKTGKIIYKHVLLNF